MSGSGTDVAKGVALGTAGTRPDKYPVTSELSLKKALKLKLYFLIFKHKQLTACVGAAGSLVVRALSL